jgi:hypothetical protein
MAVMMVAYFHIQSAGKPGHTASLISQATAMIQITPVMATTALMPVSFHMMFTARSPEAATRNYRNRASQP